MCGECRLDCCLHLCPASSFLHRAGIESSSDIKSRGQLSFGFNFGCSQPLSYRGVTSHRECMWEILLLPVYQVYFYQYKLPLDNKYVSALLSF